MQRAMGYAGAWHIDDGRYAQEILPPRTYLAASYYWRWALGMEKNLLARGLVTEDELKPAIRCGRAEVAAQAHEGCRGRRHDAQLAFRQQQGPPLQAGRPRAHQEHQSADAYRLPRYARDKVGTVELIHGCHAYGSGRDRSRRRSAVALYRRVRRPRDLGTGYRSDADDFDRRLRALSRTGMTANVTERPTIPVAGIPSDAKARCSASRGRRRPRHGAGAAQARPVHLAGMGRDSCRRDQAGRARSRHRRHLFLGIGLNALERLVTEKGITDAAFWRAITTPGTTPPTAPARRSDRTQARGFQVDASILRDPSQAARADPAVLGHDDPPAMPRRS